MSPQDFVQLVQRTRFRLTDEKSVQEALSKALSERGIPHEREVTLGPGDIVDFMLPDGLAVEIKIKASRRAIYRQCERYCRSEKVSALVLATATATGFPPELAGKPCWVASLGTGCL